MISVYYNKTSKIKNLRDLATAKNWRPQKIKRPIRFSRKRCLIGLLFSKIFPKCSSLVQQDSTTGLFGFISDLFGLAINFESVRSIAHFAVWIFAHFEVVINAELS